MSDGGPRRSDGIYQDQVFSNISMSATASWVPLTDWNISITWISTPLASSPLSKLYSFFSGLSSRLTSAVLPVLKTRWSFLARWKFWKSSLLPLNTINLDRCALWSNLSTSTGSGPGTGAAQKVLVNRSTALSQPLFGSTSVGHLKLSLIGWIAGYCGKIIASTLCFTEVYW